MDEETRSLVAVMLANLEGDATVWTRSQLIHKILTMREYLTALLKGEEE